MFWFIVIAAVVGLVIWMMSDKDSPNTQTFSAPRFCPKTVNDNPDLNTAYYRLFSAARDIRERKPGVSRGVGITVKRLSGDQFRIEAGYTCEYTYGVEDVLAGDNFYGMSITNSGFGYSIVTQDKYNHLYFNTSAIIQCLHSCIPDAQVDYNENRETEIFVSASFY